MGGDEGFIIEFIHFQVMARYQEICWALGICSVSLGQRWLTYSGCLLWARHGARKFCMHCFIRLLDDAMNQQELKTPLYLLG